MPNLMLCYPIVLQVLLQCFLSPVKVCLVHLDLSLVTRVIGTMSGCRWGLGLWPCMECRPPWHLQGLAPVSLPPLCFCLNLPFLLGRRPEGGPASPEALLLLGGRDSVPELNVLDGGEPESEMTGRCYDLVTLRFEGACVRVMMAVTEVTKNTTT